MSIKFEYAINVEPYEHVVKKKVASELVEALQNMVESYQYEASPDNPALLQARAAIAKALGESK